MIKSRKKCIAIFSAYIPPHVGGIERYTFNLVKQFLKLGYRPIVITSNYNNDKEYEVINGVVTIRLPIYNLFKNRYPLIKLNEKTKKLMNKLDNYNVCRVIVNARFYFTSLIGVRYANKKNIPVYVIEHGSNYVTLNNKFIDFFSNCYEDFITFFLKKKVTGFYGVSDACCKWLNNFSIKASGVWYNSIDFKEITFEEKNNNQINFLYAGRIIKQKGVYNILKSFSRLVSKYNNINLYISGDGPELDKYKSNFVHNRIYFLGNLNFDQLLKYYSICDVFLYPPLWPEGMPTSILEAAMTKCAIIATDQGGIKELVDNDNGIIVDGNIDDLVKAMERLILDENLRERYANNLYNTAKDKFTWEKTAKKILKDMGLE